MRTILLAGCAAILATLLTYAGAAVAQTSAPSAETPTSAAPVQAAPVQAEPAETAPAAEGPEENDPPEGPDETPSAPQRATPSTREATPAPAPQAPATTRRPPRAPLADAPPVARSINKGRACRIEARRRGLRGPDASGYAAICFAEARLACTKQAAERRLQRRALNAFVRECLGFPARNRQP